jgi:hypothetical protein
MLGLIYLLFRYDRQIQFFYNEAFMNQGISCGPFIEKIGFSDSFTCIVITSPKDIRHFFKFQITNLSVLTF